MKRYHTSPPKMFHMYLTTLRGSSVHSWLSHLLPPFFATFRNLDLNHTTLHVSTAASSSDYDEQLQQGVLGILLNIVPALLLSPLRVRHQPMGLVLTGLVLLFIMAEIAKQPACEQPLQCRHAQRPPLLPFHHPFVFLPCGLIMWRRLRTLKCHPAAQCD